MSIFSFLNQHKPQPQEQVTPLSDEVRQAWERWQAALAYFNTVSDPDLVECAIHNIESTRKHYMYLLKNLRQEDAPSPEHLSSITTLRQATPSPNPKRKTV